MRNTTRRFGLAMAALGLVAAGTGVSRASLVIQGTNSAVFVNPSPSSATTTGVGTSNFTWGVGSPPSSLSFVAVNPINTVSEMDFNLGTLTYYNGAINGGTQADTVDFKETISFTTPPAGSKDFAFQLQLINTPNTGSPDDNADFVNLPSAFSSTTFTDNGTTYTLKILGFRNVVGDGFLTSNPLQFHVREDASAQAELWGRVTTELPPPAVPEPSTLISASVAVLMGLGHGWRRRKAKKIAAR